MEITDQRYQELLKAEQSVVTLKEENNKMKETAENTAIALKSHRTEEDKLKKQISDLDSKILDKDKELLDKTEKEKSLGETAKKWEDYQKQQSENLTKSIEDIKGKLGDKLTDEHKSFIEGLPNEKVESYLKGLIPTESKPGTPNLTTPPGGKPINADGKFEQALSSNDITSAISMIPV